MEYTELRSKVQNWPKYEGCISVKRAPLINSCFPGTFNLSFSEMPWSKEYGRYIDFDHDFVFSTIQNCIRPNDLPLLRTEHSWRYLGPFEMADLTGIITLARVSDKTLQEKQIRDMLTFLKTVGIASYDIYPVYCAGGTVKELTAGKYDFDKTIPEDTISKNAFLENGIPESNLIPDRTRSSFLALHVYDKASPWGYRNEINFNFGDRERPDFIDLATLEYGLWRPLFRNDDETKAENTYGLLDAQDGFFINVIGLERLCMVVNHLPSIRDVNYIAPVYDAYQKFNSLEDELAIECLRSLHRIFSDIKAYGCIPGWHQKKKIRYMLQNLPKELTETRLEELLSIHSDTQPWHPELRDGIGPTIERIVRYRASKY